MKAYILHSTETFMEGLSDTEVKYWALYAQIYDFLRKSPEGNYSLLRLKLKGEPLKALEYFYNTYFENGVSVLAEKILFR